MTRYAILIAAAAVAVRCGSPMPATDEEAAQAQETRELSGRMAMTGMDLYMHDYRPTAGGARKPTIWVHSDEGEISTETSAWTLGRSRAVLYREDGEDIILQAMSGSFDETNETAQLGGGVKVTTGSLAMELEEIEWDNKEGVARSTGPVTITQGRTLLNASSLVLNPDEDTMLLTNGNGRIDLTDGSKR